MRLPSLLAALLAPAALIACAADPDRTPVIAAIPVTNCGPDPALEEQEVVVEGTVVDFLTGAPQPGVTVDVARAWEPQAQFPRDSCSLARFTTDADGRFGPLSVKVGPRPGLFETKFIVFLAQGGTISPTASDARVTDGAMEHTIEAPSLDVIDEWRSELDDGGMDRARTRGLVAFRYDDATGAPAPGVVATNETLIDSRPLARGGEVRYLSADRATVEPESRSATTDSGIALIGLTPSERGTRDIGGVRGSDSWGDIGCLVGEGWLFTELSRPIAR